jgi:hypothetical protein
VVRRDTVNKVAAMAFLALLLGAARPAFSGEELVLIVSARSSITQLDSSSVRKLFLGLTVTQNSNRLRPALNEADAQIKELFLQNVVSMSDSTYDRYVLRHSLLNGQSQPTVYKSTSQLIDAVAADTTLVSYAWQRDVFQDGRITVLRVLWHD